MRASWIDEHRYRGRALTAWGLLLIAVTLGLYGIALRQPFTSDDYQYLFGCERLHGVGVFQAFRPAVQAQVLPPFYRPTSVFLFLVVCRLCGPNPAAYHGLMLALRILTLLLALALFSEVFGEIRWGGIAALLLAVSTFGLEPVLWAAALPDSLLTLFSLGAVFSFHRLGAKAAGARGPLSDQRGARAEEWVWFAGTQVCGLLALASKEPAVLLPFVLICLPARAKALGKAAIGGLVVADILYALLRMWMQVHIPPPAGYDYWHLFGGIRHVDWWIMLGRSIGCLVVGMNLLPAVAFLGLVLLLAAIGASVRSPWALPRCWLLLAVLLIVMALGITGGVDQPRYGYLPSIGVVLIAAATIRLGWRRMRWATAGVLAAWIAFQAAYGYAWVSEWSSAAGESERFARFLASRPASEETVLMWIPQFRIDSLPGGWGCRSYGLTDSLYPAWIKELARKGSRAAPLTLVAGLSGRLPVTRSLEGGCVEVQSECHLIDPALPSIYTGQVEPDIRHYADVLAATDGRVLFRLKRAPNRRFFSLTDQGWYQL